MISIETLEKPLNYGLSHEIEHCLLITRPLTEFKDDVKRLSHWAEILEAQNSYLINQRKIQDQKIITLLKGYRFTAWILIGTWMIIIVLGLIEIIRS